ncbi:MAG: ethanolamine ammonia-lyase subunit EutB [Planctomycetaceae bacterium]
MVPRHVNAFRRRQFLVAGCSAGLLATTRGYGATPSLSSADQNLVTWVQETAGKWDQSLYCRMLGAANEFKEGDAIIGVAAKDEAERRLARDLLSRTTLAAIDQHPPYVDELSEFLKTGVDQTSQASMSHLTLAELRTLLLTRPEEELHRIRRGLSSDVIACVVRLMTNEDLVLLGSRLFNSLPGSQIGAKGYLGARIQPNSPTDNVDDIRWQVFDAFSYAVGDVLLGTNPVSSDPESVASVEKTLQDVLQTFDLTDVMPHCVLAHVDVQAEVEKLYPGSTAFWFQSIAGNDGANRTFDISVQKMKDHASTRTGKFGLYFETGQGADFTNGHGYGTDMVVFESRKYGFARALTAVVASSLKEHKKPWSPWVHLNDVAGFIGPEVFRTREQLVRCCLEDIAMGKLHGLTIGLDVCSTLHMDVSLDDLGWCIDQIMPANPAYLMALPTRIDPMLGYLTTGYQDHVHIREKFGYRVDDRMWQFFQALGVIDAEGKPTSRFGDPLWVYQQYCRRKGDARSDEQIREEGRQRLAEVRARGVFIAEGYGAKPSELNPQLSREIHRIYDAARECIWKELTPQFAAAIPGSVLLKSRSVDRTDYILHPISGEHLSEDSQRTVKQLREQSHEQFDTQIVISDGLNATAVTEGDQLTALLTALRVKLEVAGCRISPNVMLVHGGRVRAGYRIGEQLFGGREGQFSLLHVIGERPGSGHHTLSIYMTVANGTVWGKADQVDHNITKVVSGIASTALLPELAANEAVRILNEMRAGG